ncbi:MAG: alpha/beta hydrolase-fold protein [Planctomycetota bacterium]
MHVAMFLAATLFGILSLPAMVLGEGPDASTEMSVEISEAKKDNDGFLVYRVRSGYQSGPTRIKVLLPDRLEEGRRYAVLYVLPVEAGEGTRWGDGLVEVKKHDLHNRHRLICVLPTFLHLPWYADHPADPGIRQESHFVRVVVPFVERSYPAIREPEGRLLVGFSKSGWGAFSLLLRNPQLFGKAAAWDAPLVEESPGRFGMGPIFGTRENFEHYRISALLEKRAGELRENKRLVLTGYDNFRADHVKIHEQLVALGIPHVYRDGPHREHQWHSGWLPEAVELFVNPNASTSSERKPR